jgi:hypothetical protein
LVAFTDVNNTNGVNVLLTGNGTTTPNKTIRVISGHFQVENSAYTASIFDLSDAGQATTNFLNLTAVAIASLPACATGTAGLYATVNNGVSSPTYMGAVSTTGTTTDPVFCNGTGWVYH